MLLRLCVMLMRFICGAPSVRFISSGRLRVGALKAQFHGAGCRRRACSCCPDRNCSQGSRREISTPVALLVAPQGSNSGAMCLTVCQTCTRTHCYTPEATRSTEAGTPPQNYVRTCACACVFVSRCCALPLSATKTRHDGRGI